jgi:protein required for attachment to host cells
MAMFIVVASTAVAKFFEVDNLQTNDLKIVKELNHPDSRKKVSELVSDKPGHYSTDSGYGGSFTKGDPKHTEAESFAQELAKELKHYHDENIKHDKLVIVAPSHFYSLIKKHLHFKTPEIAHLDKDYTKYTTKELTQSLREYLKYP